MRQNPARLRLVDRHELFAQFVDSALHVNPSELSALKRRVHGKRNHSKSRLQTPATGLESCFLCLAPRYFFRGQCQPNSCQGLRHGNRSGCTDACFICVWGQAVGTSPLIRRLHVGSVCSHERIRFRPSREHIVINFLGHGSGDWGAGPWFERVTSKANPTDAIGRGDCSCILFPWMFGKTASISRRWPLSLGNRLRQFRGCDHWCTHRALMWWCFVFWSSTCTHVAATALAQRYVKREIEI